MSQPHTSKDLWFVKHPTNASRYIPGHRRAHYVLAWLAISLGVALLAIVGFFLFGFYRPLVIGERGAENVSALT